MTDAPGWPPDDVAVLGSVRHPAAEICTGDVAGPDPTPGSGRHHRWFTFPLSPSPACRDRADSRTAFRDSLRAGPGTERAQLWSAAVPLGRLERVIPRWD